MVVVRYIVYGNRWFFLSGAALLHAALHGLLGMGYLVAGALALAAAVAGIAILYVRRDAAQPRHGGAP
jgi:hypothetical protein